MFCSLLAKEVRRGTLVTHEFCLMTTHFHLLVSSPVGKLSEAMQRIQSNYSRWFNRSRGRDGPLVRGRFSSRPIHDRAYRRNVAVYIRDNPVAARIADTPEEYEWSSAAMRAAGESPQWLCDDWVNEEVKARGVQTVAQAFPCRVTRDPQSENPDEDKLDEKHRKWIERQLGSRLTDELEETTLSHVHSWRTIRWAFRRAKLADGTKPFRPVSPSNVVAEVVKRFTRTVGPLLGLIPRSTRDAWANLKSGVFRALSGCTQYEIGLHVRRHGSTVCRYLKEHREILMRHPAYEVLHAQITEAVLAQLRRRSPSSAGG